MKKFILLFIFFVVLSLALSFDLVKAQENENRNNDEGRNKSIEIKHKPEKKELKVPNPNFSSHQPDPFKELDDFARENVVEYQEASFFMLTPSNHVVQQGIVEQNQNNVLTVNSNGFKVSWAVTTSTTIINSSSSVSDIISGIKVKIFGNWDGNQLVAERVMVLERRVNNEIENLIQKLKEVLRKAGINVDLNPLFQQLQR